MRLFSNKKRPVHLGPYPLERLPRLADPAAPPAGSSPSALRRPTEAEPQGPRSAGHAYGLYLDLFDGQRRGEPAPEAPVPDDPTDRAQNLKAGLYFLDADMVGTALVPDEAWTGEREPGHRFAVVTLIAHSRKLSGRQPGDEWIDGTRQVNADLRAGELAVITASFIRNLGFEAVAHTPTATEVDLDRLGLQAGLVEAHRGTLRAPFLPGGFALSVVTTDLELTPDRPLARRRLVDDLRTVRGLGWFLGREGTRAGWGRLNGDHRPLHQGRYPMERIKRVPTNRRRWSTRTRFQRVPVRSGRRSSSVRCAMAISGPKFQGRARAVFATKQPFAGASPMSA